MKGRLENFISFDIFVLLRRLVVLLPTEHRDGLLFNIQELLDLFAV